MIVLLKIYIYVYIGEGSGNPLQYSCLGNPMDREAWPATVHGVTKSWTRLINETTTIPQTLTTTVFSSLSTFGLLFFLNFAFFYLTIFYWFCHTSTCICHGCTRVPNPEPPSHLPPHTIPLGRTSAPAPSILYPASNLDWLFVSYMILYMFQCHSHKSSTLSLSHRVQNTVLYICVSFVVSHTGLSLPSF